MAAHLGVQRRPAKSQESCRGLLVPSCRLFERARWKRALSPRAIQPAGGTREGAACIQGIGQVGGGYFVRDHQRGALDYVLDSRTLPAIRQNRLKGRVYRLTGLLCLSRKRSRKPSRAEGCLESCPERGNSVTVLMRSRGPAGACVADRRPGRFVEISRKSTGTERLRPHGQSSSTREAWPGGRAASGDLVEEQRAPWASSSGPGRSGSGAREGLDVSEEPDSMRSLSAARRN